MPPEPAQAYLQAALLVGQLIQQQPSPGVFVVVIRLLPRRAERAHDALSGSQEPLPALLWLPRLPPLAGAVHAASG